MAFQIPSKSAFKDPLLIEAFSAIEDAINRSASVSGVDPVNVAETPVNRGSLAVSEANGIHDVAISDPAYQRGETYFLEYAMDPSFKTVRQIPLGPSPAWRGSLGIPGNTYWRYYKQSMGSNPSPPINFGGQSPKAVQSSAAPGPALGTPQVNGATPQSGQGYGLLGAQ